MYPASAMSGGSDVEPIRTRIWHDDRAAWMIFATGITGMIGVLVISLAFAGHGATLAELKAWSLIRVSMLLAAAVLAVSGPLIATIGQLAFGKPDSSTKKKPKKWDLDDL
jgi:hypothetical protein